MCSSNDLFFMAPSVVQLLVLTVRLALWLHMPDSSASNFDISGTVTIVESVGSLCAS